MDKPQKPEHLLPSSFGGIKENFTKDRIKTGYEPDVPQIVEGENLNYLIDGIGKNFDYNNKISDFVVGLPIDKSITVDTNNKLVYTEYGLKVYNVDETYLRGAWVTGAVDNKKTIYESLVDNNVGNSLSDLTKWKKIVLDGLSIDDKSLITNWASPDYSAGIRITSGYSAPTAGFVRLAQGGNPNGGCTLNINGLAACKLYPHGGGTNGQDFAAMVPVGQDDVVTFTYTGNASGVDFYPLKGAILDAKI